MTSIKILPQTFTTFLNSIIQAQGDTDQWKAKLFYKSIDQIWHTLLSECRYSQNIHSLQQIKIDDLIKFYAKYFKKYNYNYCPMSQQQDRKILIKYFSFKNSTLKKQQFINKLKPINNRLIISHNNINKLQTTQQCLINIFLSILNGYQNIKKCRLKCNQQKQYQKIIKFFEKNYKIKYFTQELLKQYLIQINLFDRVNFCYLRQYIFGEKSEKIEWVVLFKRCNIIITDKITEVQEENLLSEQEILIKQTDKIIQNQTKEEKEKVRSGKQFRNNEYEPSMVFQTVSQIKSMKQTIQESGKLIIQSQQDNFNSVLNQINQIQQILTKTKEKYLKNKQEIQSSTKQIRSKSKNFTKNNQQNYQKNQTKQQKQQLNDKTIKMITIDRICQSEIKQNTKNGTIVNLIYQDLHQNDSSALTKQQIKMDQSKVQIYESKKILNQQNEKISKLNLCLQKNQYHKYQDQKQNNSVRKYKSDRRQVGKIKKRSISKDKIQSQKQKQKQKKQNIYTNTCTNTYSNTNYQPKSFTNSNSNLQSKRKLTLGNQTNSSEIKLYQPFMKINNQSIQKIYECVNENRLSQYNKSKSKNKNQQIFKQLKYSQNIQPRSRVSSKKKQQIAEKATSQARLRIQAIQKRALNRLSQIDSQIQQNFKAAELKRKKSMSSYQKEKQQSIKKQNLTSLASFDKSLKGFTQYPSNNNYKNDYQNKSKNNLTNLTLNSTSILYNNFHRIA